MLPGIVHIFVFLHQHAPMKMESIRNHKRVLMMNIFVVNNEDRIGGVPTDALSSSNLKYVESS